ncbi:ChaN family lipoprotein [Serratia sp. AKBS12]|uniref:ChaN family lipoprotein n=1 Tax=Serratia sp. AKBS12 TaxID=2974597 RepID=UPI002164FD2C|nr:ChaN family lipoprotein [Serratia sp. AKBS12]MCS3407693.1 ChaN family lipoprotein [Serratia sp. AKBS12]
MKLWVFVVALMLAACSHSPANSPANQVDAAALPGKITDLHTGQSLTPAQLLDRLAAAPRLIVGEKHDNPDHHRVELWLLQRLPQQRPQGSLLLEMINPDQQARVDALQQQWRAGATTKYNDLPARLGWQAGWPWSQYGALVTAALAAPYPLMSANLDRSEIKAFYQHPQLPPGVVSTSAAVRQALATTIEQAHGGKLDAPQLQAMVAIQQQRDRRMAQRLLAAPTPSLLIAGAYHASKVVGVPLHIEDMQPAVRPAVLMLVEPGAEVSKAHADYQWVLPAAH